MLLSRYLSNNVVQRKNSINESFHLPKGFSSLAPLVEYLLHIISLPCTNIRNLKLKEKKTISMFFPIQIRDASSK